MPSLTIRHANGSTDTIPQTVRTEIKREIGKMRRGRLTVERSLADDANLEAKSDVIELPNDDNLRLVDIETGGSTWTLVGYSFEWDANTVTPTAGGTLKTGNDDTLITDFVNDVSTWSAGTITQQATGLSFVFNHAQPHEAIRRIEKNVPGEIQFRDEGVVDYTSRLGSDRSGSVTLSASAGTIEDIIEITERGRKLDGTHIRVLGAHEGEAQLFANLVPSGDPQTYENEVRYSTTRWSSSDDTEWNRFSNKDVTDQTTIEEEAAELGEELKESLVEAKATVSGVDLNVGDTVQVVKSDADLNKSMRVHRITEIQQGATETAEVLLSTRTTLRTDEDDDLKDIQRFNSGFQGSSVWGQVSGGIQAADTGLNYQLPVYYPQVEYEHEVELFVKSLPYRSFSSGGAASSGSSTTTGLVPNNTRSVIYGNDGTDSFTGRERKVVDTFTINQDAYPYIPTGVAGLARNQSETITILNMILSTPQGDVGVSNGGARFDSIDAVEVSTSTFFDLNGDTVDLELDVRIANSNTADVEWAFDMYGADRHNHTFDPPDHSHPPDPGVEEFPNEVASGVDVIVNGTVTNSNIGTGQFETVVDLSNELTKGSWNTVELSTDTLGLLYGTTSILSYRQIGQN